MNSMSILTILILAMSHSGVPYLNRPKTSSVSSHYSNALARTWRVRRAVELDGVGLYWFNEQLVNPQE